MVIGLWFQFDLAGCGRGQWWQ